MRKMTRMEANKEVRRVLNRHGVDLAYTQYSVGGMDIRLTGWLCKHDGSDYNGPQIEAMIHEFQRILSGYSISGDFENWSFTSDHISYLGEKTSNTSYFSEEAEQDDFDYEAG
jgi:hypothetical protein